MPSAVEPTGLPREGFFASTGWVIPVVLVLVAVSAGAYAWLRPRPVPPPAAIRDDPALILGREVYLDRCAACHGAEGRGDGPTAKSLNGPPPRDFTAKEWRHGDRPDQIVAVIKRGVDGTAMPGWNTTLSDEQIRDVTTFVAYLGGRVVPRRPVGPSPSNDTP